MSSRRSNPERPVAHRWSRARTTVFFVGMGAISLLGAIIFYGYLVISSA